MLQQQQQQDERHLTGNSNGNSNITDSIGSATLPPNTLNSNSETNKDQATNVMANLLAFTWLFVFMWFCCRSRPPGPEHWRGAEIRRRYLERLAREQSKKDRKLQSPEYRRRLVQHNLHTRVRMIRGKTSHGVVLQDSLVFVLTHACWSPFSLPPPNRR